MTVGILATKNGTTICALIWACLIYGYYYYVPLNMYFNFRHVHEQEVFRWNDQIHSAVNVVVTISVTETVQSVSNRRSSVRDGFF